MKNFTELNMKELETINGGNLLILIEIYDKVKDTFGGFNDGFKSTYRG